MPVLIRTPPPHPTCMRSFVPPACAYLYPLRLPALIRTTPFIPPPVRTPPLPRGCLFPWARSYALAFTLVCACLCALVLVWAGLGHGRTRLCSRVLVSGSCLGEVGTGSVVCG